MTTRHSDEEVSAAIAASRVKADANRKSFADQYRRDTARWRLETAEKALLARLTTRPISGRALLSNGHVRAVAQYALIDANVEAYLENLDRQWLWITIAWDAGVTWEREPDIDHVSLQSIVYQHLRRSGFEGFGIIETDVWKNFTGEPGRRMVAHVHFLGYATDGQHVKVTEFEDEMCARAALTNSLGVRSVDITNMTKTPADFARVGRYMLKLPTHAKDRIPRTIGGYKLKQVNHAKGSVARLTEVFSHCELGDVIFSIGKGAGKSIADKVRSAVREEIRERKGAIIAPAREEVAFHWSRIRETNGSKNFRPCRIITRREQRDAEAN